MSLTHTVIIYYYDHEDNELVECDLNYVHNDNYIITLSELLDS